MLHLAVTIAGAIAILVAAFYAVVAAFIALVAAWAFTAYYTKRALSFVFFRERQGK